MFVFEKRIGKYIVAAEKFLDHKGLEKYADILRLGKYNLETETSFDRIDGGLTLHTLRLAVPMDIFEAVSDNLADCEQALRDALNKVSGEVKNESLEEVDVSLDVENIEPDGMVKLRAGFLAKTAFDEYLIEKQIGEGGNGRVFSAKSSAGDPVAIKFLERDASDKRKRFKNEICFCEACRHPNIVEVLDRGCVTVQGVDRTFYVMPLYAESLRAKIDRGLSPEDSIGIFTMLLGALGEAHRQGVVHRDVKPENIMFAAGARQPILCDFGIAHLPLGLKETAVLTKPADHLANYRYAAPEQKEGRNDAVGSQADLYAAGLILNEMFTRQVPSAEGYKKIGDVVPEYGFLDAVFSELYQQDPSRRLCPAEKVLMDLRSRALINNNEKILRELSEARVEAEAPGWQDLCVMGLSYKEPSLVFEMNERVPDEWLTVLRRGSYNHTSAWGCDTESVTRVGEKTLCIPVSVSENEGLIKQKIEYFSAWVRAANAKYKEALDVQFKREIQRKEDDRKREISQLENANRIQQLLAKI